MKESGVFFHSAKCQTFVFQMEIAQNTLSGSCFVLNLWKVC